MVWWLRPVLVTMLLLILVPVAASTDEDGGKFEGRGGMRTGILFLLDKLGV